MKKGIKSLFWSFSLLGALAMPAISVVACGTASNSDSTNSKPTTPDPVKPVKTDFELVTEALTAQTRNTNANLKLLAIPRRIQLERAGQVPGLVGYLNSNKVLQKIGLSDIDFKRMSLKNIDYSMPTIVDANGDANYTGELIFEADLVKDVLDSKRISWTISGYSTEELTQAEWKIKYPELNKMVLDTSEYPELEANQIKGVFFNINTYFFDKLFVQNLYQEFSPLYKIIDILKNRYADGIMEFDQHVDSFKSPYELLEWSKDGFSFFKGITYLYEPIFDLSGSVRLFSPNDKIIKIPAVFVNTFQRVPFVYNLNRNRDFGINRDDDDPASFKVYAPGFKYPSSLKFLELINFADFINYNDDIFSNAKIPSTVESLYIDLYKGFMYNPLAVFEKINAKWPSSIKVAKAYSTPLGEDIEKPHPIISFDEMPGISAKPYDTIYGTPGFFKKVGDHLEIDMDSIRTKFANYVPTGTSKYNPAAKAGEK